MKANHNRGRPPLSAGCKNSGKQKKFKQIMTKIDFRLRSHQILPRPPLGNKLTVEKTFRKNISSVDLHPEMRFNIAEHADLLEL